MSPSTTGDVSSIKYSIHEKLDERFSDVLKPPGIINTTVVRV